MIKPRYASGLAIALLAAVGLAAAPVPEPSPVPQEIPAPEFPAAIDVVTVDVVVLDVKLPGISGLDVLRQLRQRDPTVEVLLLTGHPNVHDALAGVGLGALEYLSKPLEVDSLVEAIQRAHRKRQQGLEAARRETVRAALERIPE